MNDKRLYMAYGSNLNLGQMARLCPNARIISHSVLNDYHLLFRGKNGKAMLNIEKQKNNNVPVIIWKINREDEKALDIFEEYPTVYHKEYLKVDVNGEIKEPMVYVMNEGYPIGLPSESYFNTVCDGYKTANFDISILKKIREMSDKTKYA